MLIIHVVRALNPEEDKSGVNVKMARKALEIELNKITKLDENVAKAVKAKSPDFNDPVFTDQNYGRIVENVEKEQILVFFGMFIFLLVFYKNFPTIPPQDLYNIAKTLIDWKLEITKRDEIIDDA